MKKSVISKTEPVNTSPNYWWNGVTFLVRQAGVSQAWEADKIRNYG